ncbi:SRPBCC family protein [Granulicoccus phenolivorans]|uniref:SRPBCC family protein n=1 Tax=Granulicoccus phenolivorans TaxID=266854 RepID=UPI00068549B8|nr:SRPBCC family protein [Granulicoccus phenolivorans]
MAQIQKQARVEVVVPASPEEVWAVISDVTRIDEWSGECRSGQWLDGAERAAVGTRFKGANRAGQLRWSRTCEFVEVDRPRLLAWRTLPTVLLPDSTRWQIELAEAPGGTRITQSYDVLRLPPVWDRVYAVTTPSHRDRALALIEDLRRLGEAARSAKPTSAPS